ncbi:MAG: aldo/keto reductase [Pirellulaceae bacterium]
METIQLGTLRRPVTRLGFCGCPLGGYGWGDVDEHEGMAAVRRALELGITFFDTADIYGLGRSEELLSRALGDSRHDVVIATKFGVRRTADGRTVRDITPRYVREALEASLRRLRIECIPLYYIHWPDGVTPIEDTVLELDRCRTAGKIESLGVSNFSAEQLRTACSMARISAMQVQYSLVDQALVRAIRQTAMELDVPLVTWGSLAQGLLTGKYTASTQFLSHDRRSRYVNFQGDKLIGNLRVVDEVRCLAAQLGRSPGQIALRWLLDSPAVGCVLFGAKRPDQVSDNVQACGWQLSASDYARLESLNPERALKAA